MSRRPLRFPADQVAAMLARLLTGAVVLIAGWLMVSLLAQTQLPSPRPPAALSESAEQSASAIAHRQLLGTVTATPAAAPSNQAYRLLGVIAANASAGGAAILQAEGSNRSQVVRVGESLGEGLSLSRVDARSVTLNQHGREITLTLPEKTAGPATALPQQPQVFKD